MKFRYLDKAQRRRGTAHIYSYMARYRVHELESIIDGEISSHITRAALASLTPAIRVHEAGDFISGEHIAMWERLARRYPMAVFWAYTRSDLANQAMSDAIHELASLDNVHVRASFDPANIEDVTLTRNGLPGAIIVGRTHRGIKHGPARVPGAVNCPEQATNGAISCADCGLCWHASRPVIRFWAH